MIGAVEVLFLLRVWSVQLVKTEENILHILNVRLSEAEVLAERFELCQKAQQVENVAQK